MLPSIRPDQIDLLLENSGLNVWLYDEANLARLAAPLATDAGCYGTPADVENKVRDGLLVGYTLQCGSDAQVAVLLGAPLTPGELDVARWHTPQYAWLRLPTGALNVETDDLSRLGPVCSRTRSMAVSVPPGVYRVTLYRVDYEALDMLGEVWPGSAEYIVLTAGGSPTDAAHGVLEFEDARAGRGPDAPSAT